MFLGSHSPRTQRCLRNIFSRRSNIFFNHRNLSQIAYSLNEFEKYNSILSDLKQSNSSQIGSNSNDIRYKIYQLPNKLDFLNYLIRNNKLKESETLIGLESFNEGLLLINCFNVLHMNDYQLNPSISNLITDRLIAEFPKFGFDGFDLKDPIDITLIILRLSLSVSGFNLSFTIINELMKRLNGDLVNSELSKKLIAQLINETNLELLIDSLLIKNPKTDYKRIKQVFEIVSKYNRLITKLNSKNPELKLKAYLINQSQFNSIIENSLNLLSSTEDISPSESIEVSELVIKELGFNLSKNSNNLPGYGNDQELNDIENLNFNTLMDLYLSFCYKYIEGRLKCKDLATVYSTWTLIKPFHNRNYHFNINSANNNTKNNFYFYDIISQLITNFSKNKRYIHLVSELLQNLPIDAIKVSPRLMSSLIIYSSRSGNTELSELLMKQYDDSTLGLPTRYSPKQLTSLLTLCMRQGDYDRANKIMSFAKDHLIHFSAVEFNELIRATIAIDKKNRSETAWKLLSGVSGSLGKYGYISYLNYMISSLKKVDFDKTEFMFRNAIKEVSFKDKNFWDYWIASYFKYIIRFQSVQSAIKVYNNSAFSSSDKYEPFKTINEYHYHINPFTTRIDKVKLHLSNESKPLIIRDIFQKTFTTYNKALHSNSVDTENYRENFKQVGIWCFMMFKELGYQDSSIGIDLSKTIHHKKRKVGFTTHAKDGHEVEDVHDLEETFVDNAKGFQEQWSQQSNNLNKIIM